MNRRYFVGIGLFALFLLMFYNLSEPYPTTNAEIDEGIYHGTQWDFSEDGVIFLNGMWRFYPNEFVSYEEILETSTPDDPIYLNVPQAWNNQMVDGAYLRPYGYGTYQLDLHIDHINNPVLALRIGDFFSAYELYWNDVLISSNGTLGKSRQDSSGYLGPKVAVIQTDRSHNILTLRISNFQQSNGGAWGKLQIGEPDDIYTMTIRNVGFQMFFTGLLFIIGWYHIILYLILREENSALIFGLFSLTLSLRQLSIEARMINHVFPDMPFGIKLSIEYMTFYIGVTLFAIFLYMVYRDIFSKMIIRVIQVVGFGLGFLVLVTPPWIFTRSLVYFQYFTILIVFYTVYIVIRGIRTQQKGSDILLFGAMAILFAAINDLLNNYRIIDTGYSMSFALMVFLFCQSVVIANNNAGTYYKALFYADKNKAINKELNELNMSLEQKVADRTKELETKNRSLARLTKVDRLTGLYNHTTITGKLNELIDDVRRGVEEGQIPLAVAMLDIDHFKAINDTYGHQAGDGVLEKISETIDVSIRKSDLLGRYGGEEFMLILPDTELQVAVEVLERVRMQVEDMRFDQEALGVTISAGLVALKPDENGAAVIKRADNLLYEAKNTGRNRVVHT